MRRSYPTGPGAFDDVSEIFVLMIHSMLTVRSSQATADDRVFDVTIRIAQIKGLSVPA